MLHLRGRRGGAYATGEVIMATVTIQEAAQHLGVSRTRLGGAYAKRSYKLGKRLRPRASGGWWSWRTWRRTPRRRLRRRIGPT